VGEIPIPIVEAEPPKFDSRPLRGCSARWIDKKERDEESSLLKLKAFPTHVGRPNNSAADCSTAFKFGTEFHHVTDDTLQMFKVKGQRSGSQGQRSRPQRKVIYHRQKSHNMAMDMFSEFKLGMAL